MAAIVQTDLKPTQINTVQAEVQDAAQPCAEKIRHAFESGKYPYGQKMARKTYEAEKAKLQAELLKVQLWAQETGQRFVLLFEGRDAAGKGGTIKRFMEHLNPRQARVVALNKPTWEEKGQWFYPALHRRSCPRWGEMVFYDRSWYKPGRCRAGDGVLFAQRIPGVHAPDARTGADAGPIGHPPLQVLVLGHAGRTEAAVQVPRNRSAEALEAVADRQGQPQTNGMTIPRRRRRCSFTPTLPTRPGPWSSRTTRNARGSTACGISCQPGLPGQG